jgi:hypothetical protein
MNNNTQLENYLVRLERSLGPIPISDKAEIITEIKSHVLDAQESGDTSLSDILSSLGEPEQVANRYLLERGLEPLKAPKHPIVKWLVIGFLGTFAMSIFTLFILIWQFSPIVKVDEENGRVQILGGLIDINEKGGKVEIGNLKGDFKLSLSEVSGHKDLDKNNLTKVLITASNSEIVVNTSDSREFRYDCDISGESEIKTLNDTLVVDFSKGSNADCKFKIPKEIDLSIESLNGEISLVELENNITLSLLNGDVVFKEKSDTDYNFDLKLTNGNSRQFKNSDNKNAFQINMNIQNGSIN